jgi:integrase
MRRASYQRGTLRTIRRKDGSTVWEYRWRETQIDGTRRRRATIVGTLEDYPNASLVQTAVDALRLTINQQTPQALVKNISVETLVNHYREHELPEIFSKKNPGSPPGEEQRKSYATQDVYDGYLRKWILPRWKSYRLTEIKAVEVEKWLKSLCFSNGIPLAKGTKAKVRNIMSGLYSHAIRWEWAERNPITSVRQSAKRQRTPEVLTIAEVVNLLGAIPEPFRTAVFLDGSSGLRVGELLGLKWEDVDFDKNVIHIRRSIVKQRIGPPKTEASQKPIPLDAELANSLWLWKQETPYNGPSDWVYASPAKNGRQPYWPSSIYRVYIKRAAEGTGLKKRIGWHTFRHTFGTILNANGENPKVIQELLRHANLRVTMDTYVQAVSNEKREAQSRVVRLLSPGLGKKLV